MRPSIQSWIWIWTGPTLQKTARFGLLWELMRVGKIVFLGERCTRAWGIKSFVIPASIGPTKKLKVFLISLFAPPWVASVDVPWLNFVALFADLSTTLWVLLGPEPLHRGSALPRPFPLWAPWKVSHLFCHICVSSFLVIRIVTASGHGFYHFMNHDLRTDGPVNIHKTQPPGLKDDLNAERRKCHIVFFFSGFCKGDFGRGRRGGGGFVDTRDKRASGHG
jgi:hypothetical protein